MSATDIEGTIDKKPFVCLTETTCLLSKFKQAVAALQTHWNLTRINKGLGGHRQKVGMYDTVMKDGLVNAAPNRNTNNTLSDLPQATDEITVLV